MKRYCMLLLLLTASGCNLFKNTGTESSKSEADYSEKLQMMSLGQEKLQMDSGSLMIHQDSSIYEFTIALWPKGLFSYSSATGFTGEADRVLIKGRKKFAVRDSTISQLRVRDSVRFEGQIKQERKVTNKDVTNTKTASPSSLIILGILIIMIVTGISLFKK